MVESLESSIRANIQVCIPLFKLSSRLTSCAPQEIYFGKTRDIVGMLRSVESLDDARKQDDLRRELMEKMRR